MATPTHQPHIPSAVAAAEAEALRMLAQHQAGGAPADADAGDDGTGTDGDGQAEGALPETVVDDQRLSAETFGAVPGDATAATPSGDGDVWRQRYQVLKGKYDAELPRLAAEAAELRGTVRTLTAVLETLRGQGGGQETAAGQVHGPAGVTGANGAEPTDAELAELVGDPRVLEEFGPDFFRSLARFQKRVQATAKPAELETLQAEVRELRPRVEQMGRAQLESGLDQMLPNWRSQNSDQRFIRWMQATTEPRSGQLYVDLLRGAMARSDIEGIAAVFRDWPEQTAAAGGPARVPVRRQVTVRPGAGGIPPQTGAPKKVWTQQDILTAATRLATGELGPARAKALRDEMDQAIADGRVR